MQETRACSQPHLLRLLGNGMREGTDSPSSHLFTTLQEEGTRYNHNKSREGGLTSSKVVGGVSDSDQINRSFKVHACIYSDSVPLGGLGLALCLRLVMGLGEGELGYLKNRHTIIPLSSASGPPEDLSP